MPAHQRPPATARRPNEGPPRSTAKCESQQYEDSTFPRPPLRPSPARTLGHHPLVSDPASLPASRSTRQPRPIRSPTDANNSTHRPAQTTARSTHRQPQPRSSQTTGPAKGASSRSGRSAGLGRERPGRSSELELTHWLALIAWAPSSPPPGPSQGPSQLIQRPSERMQPAALARCASGRERPTNRERQARYWRAEPRPSVGRSSRD